jgi:hypothetical protein
MIVGVDVSSRRIDWAWIEDGKPQRAHLELGTAKTHLIDRVREAHWITWPQGADWDTTDVAIEMPFGQSRKSVSALMATVGAVTASVPGWARVAWPSSGELRAAIGAKNTKQSAHEMVSEVAGLHYYVGTETNWYWNEHELDALTACIGWTRILAQQDAA